MSADKILVFSIGILIILFIAISLMEYMVIINLKIDYDLICRKYFWIAEMEGGISDEKSNELSNILASRGFENVKVNSPKGVQYGDEVSLEIESKRKFNLAQKLFFRKTESINFTFKKTTISRRVAN